MAERIATVTHALDAVESAGQARAAIAAALAELDRGQSLVPGLNGWSYPNPDQAYAILAPYRPALEAEQRIMAVLVDDAAVDGPAWSRARREIDRVYIEVAGIEGAAGAVAAIDVGEILADAVANAPAVFGAAVGGGLKAVGSAAGGLGAGFFGGLGIVGTLVVLLVVLVVLRKAVVA